MNSSDHATESRASLHRRRGEVAHQDVRQRRRADHHAEDDAEEVQRRVVHERLDVRPQRPGRTGLLVAQDREPVLHKLRFARADLCDRPAVCQFRDRDAVMLCGQNDDRHQIGDDQHDVLRDLRPGHRAHAAQHRAEQDADEAGEHREFELHAEEARGDEPGAVDLRRHISKGAADQHDHAEEAGEVAAVTEREEVGDRVGAELAQIGADQDRDQHEAAGPAEHPGKAVIAEQEQRAGHADEGRRRHPVGAGRHAVVERGNAPSGDIVFGNFGRPRHDADDGIDREREEHEQVAEDLVRYADLLENREQDDEGDEAARVGAVHAAEILDEIRCAAGSLSCHDDPPVSLLRRSRARGRSCPAASRT